MLKHAVVDLPKKVSGDARVSEDAHVAMRHSGCYFYFVIDVHGLGDLKDKKRNRLLNEEKRRMARFIESELAIACYRFGGTDQVGRVIQEITKAVDSQFSHGLFGAVLAGVVIDENGVSTVHMGDSRVYAFDPDLTKGYRQLTQDHNLTNKSELARLRQLSDDSFRIVTHPVGQRPLRVEDMELRLHYVDGSGEISCVSLAMTRGLGNQFFRPAFSQLPEINWWPHRQFVPETILAVCSDGANQAVEKTFRYYTDINVMPDAAACKFRCESLLRAQDPSDDATALFIPLQEEATEELAFFKH